MRRTLAIAGALLLLAAGPAAAERKNETVAFVKFDKHVAILAKVGQDKSAFTFAIKATNKAFDDDVYVGSGPLRAKVSCFSFKSSSGFSLTVEPPRFSVSGDTLVIDQSIPRPRALQARLRRPDPEDQRQDRRVQRQAAPERPGQAREEVAGAEPRGVAELPVFGPGGQQLHEGVPRLLREVAGAA
ncbi:MAG: hypothetical protein HYU26_00575 [Candidatus Rokubacteria bacterium]|nr:hypothetical protein [Candidatus Rokubacteria bacterium]